MKLKNLHLYQYVRGVTALIGRRGVISRCCFVAFSAISMLGQAWADNTAPEFTFFVTPNFTHHTISNKAFGDHEIVDPYGVTADDLDGDGDTDVIVASINDDKLVWFENDGFQVFTAHTIADNANGAKTVTTVDLDEDGDIDVILGTEHDDTVEWYENDGSQGFTRHIITNALDSVSSVNVADVDGDGDIDVVTASPGIHTIAWLENDGSESFTVHTMPDTARNARSASAADVDGDGDIDLLAAWSRDSKIAWYENDGAQGFTAHTITDQAGGTYSVTSADINGDGNMDVLSASLWDEKVEWYENDGNGGFTVHTISVSSAGPFFVSTGDIDGDGDVDVFSTGLYGTGGAVSWYENDGTGMFSQHVILDSAESPYFITSADVDSDGDLDILASSDGVVHWFENSGGRLNTLDNNPTYIEGDYLVLLDTDVVVFDDELSGVDSFDGATLTLSRNGGYNDEDQFIANDIGTMSALVEGDNLVVNGIDIGDIFTNSEGILELSFNANATNALVNEALGQIGYSNTSNTPPPSVLIDWVINDGGDSVIAQGAPGALESTGSINVTITAVNDAPTGTVVLSNLSPAVGDVLGAADNLADEDGLGPIDYQWQLGGVDIIGATGATYTVNQSDVGSSLRVIASYTDGQGTIETVSSVGTAAVSLLSINDVALAAVLEDSDSADGANNTDEVAVTVAQLEEVDGLTGVVTANESLYQAAIAAETGFSNPPTVVQVQTIIDAVNAQVVLLAEVLEDSLSEGGSDNDNVVAVTANQLAAISGIVDVRPVNESLYQAAIAAETGFSNPPTVVQVQTIIDAVNTQVVLLAEVLEDSVSEGGADNNNAVAVTANQLAAISGIVDVRPVNESLYQAAIAAETGFSNPPTVVQVQTIIDAINASQSILELILSQSSTEDGLGEGNVSAFQLGQVIGLIGVETDNELAYQGAIANETDFSNPPTIAEVQFLIDSHNDSDGDAISDADEQGVDTDLDGYPDNLDRDSDNDTILDSIEGVKDSDGDGVADFRDVDSDNDGIYDIIERSLSPSFSKALDQNSDGQLDAEQSIGDYGLFDGAESDQVQTPPLDTDLDEVVDYLDLDSDNDGVLDVAEAGYVDANLDGIIDSISVGEVIPTSSQATLLADDSGIAAVLGNPIPRDTDVDSVADFRDVDSDNDGLMDIQESFTGLYDEDGDGRWDNFVDTNNNGVMEIFEASPSIALDTDDDGSANYIDLDSDDDGLSDLQEWGGVDTDSNGIVDDLLDSNGDGADDILAMLVLVPVDSDQDGLPDYQDTDSDNDGVTDLLASGGVDLDGDGEADGLTPGAAAPDSDSNVAPNQPQAANGELISVGIGAGCSITGRKLGAGTDPLLAGLVLGSLAWLVFRVRARVRGRLQRTRRSEPVSALVYKNARTSLTPLVLLSMLSSGNAIGHDPWTKAERSSADGEPKMSAAMPQYKGFDSEKFYAAASIGVSNFSPDMSQAPSVSLRDSTGQSAQFALGRDINSRFGVELHGATLGTAEFSTSDQLDYQQLSASTVVYLGRKHRTASRKGFLAFGRIGAGLMMVDGLTENTVPIRQRNKLSVLFGAGVEFGMKNGLGFRAEWISTQQDVQFAQVGILYRFGKSDP